MRLRLLLALAVATPVAFTTGCATSSTTVVAVQTLKAVGEAAEATVATSARLYAAGAITEAQARAIATFYDARFQPAFRVAADGVNTGITPAPANLIALASDLSALLDSYRK